MNDFDEKRTYVSREEVEGRIALDDSPTTVCVTNHIIEIVTCEKHQGKTCSIRRLDKHYYVNLRTGEIKEFRKVEDRDRTVNMNPKFTALRQLINKNFHGLFSEIHLILTYDKEMKEREKASVDFKAFWKRIKRFYSGLDYIVIYEPTEKGVWHIHVLVKDSGNRKLFIPKEHLKELWGQGFVRVLRISNNDNIGAYFVALLSEDRETKSKKANRLRYYKKGYRVFSKSKGIESPTYLKMPYKEAMQLVKGLEPCFEEQYGIYDKETNEEINVIYRKEYNTRRQKND